MRLLVCYFLFIALPAQAQMLQGKPAIIDGDTLIIQGTKVRLLGTDAPEYDQWCHRGTKSYACGQEAITQLEHLLHGKAVRCYVPYCDRYQRGLATCYANDTDIGAWMVSHGYALAYRQYGNTYALQEDYARAQHLGLWSGAFAKPWVHRTDMLKSQIHACAAPRHAYQRLILSQFRNLPPAMNPHSQLELWGRPR